MYYRLQLGIEQERAGVEIIRERNDLFQKKEEQTSDES
jgi:hypothetical protein